MVTKQYLQTYNGKQVHLYTLTDKISATISTFGATVTSLLVPDKKGKMVDVALGMTNVEDMIYKGSYMGAVVGRCGNRICDGKFVIEGKQYKVACNDGGKAHLHGGNVGFDKRVWDAEEGANSVTFSLYSPDGQEGYPGNLQISVKYSVVGSKLIIEYFGKTDKTTIFNPTNHTYFNLSGENDGSILDNQMQIFADSYLAVDGNLIPTSRVNVEGTPFDFRTSKPIGQDIKQDYAQLGIAGGYDHNFCLNGNHAAKVYSPKTGIVMDVFTDMPGVQFYSGNFLTGPVGKSKYEKHAGFCLETQYFPNAINNAEYASPLLRADEEAYSKTSYEFSVK